MRKLIVVLALALAASANPAHAEWQWQHFGVAPYASSRDEAMQARESAFRKLGLPQEVVTLLMEATKKPGESSALKNGDRFNAQIQKSGIVHGLKDGGGVVAFDPNDKKLRGMQLSAEKWQVTWGDKAYTAVLPDVCYNWTSIIGSPPAPPAPPTAEKAPPASPTVPPVFTTSVCPSGFTLVANAWPLKSLPSGSIFPGMREEADKLIKAANERDSQEAMRIDAYKPDAFSRTMGGRLRSEVQVRAPITADLPIRYLDPKTVKVVRELGVVHMVRGVGSFRFPDDPRPYVVETIWPADFVSPARSGGERRLRLFGYEWDKFCEMNEHGAEVQSP